MVHWVDACALVLTLVLGLGMPVIAMFATQLFESDAAKDLCVLLGGPLLSGVLLAVFLFHLHLLFPDKRYEVGFVAGVVIFCFLFLVVPFALLTYSALHFFDNFHLH